MWETLKELFKGNMQSCFYKSSFGIECPGCGVQRSIYLLMEGDFIASIKMFPALMPIILMIILLVFHLKFKFRHGAILLKILFIISVCLMFLNYIYKMIL